MILTKKERAVMNVVFREAQKNDGMCILTPEQILGGIPLKIAFAESDLEPTLNALQLDQYIAFEQASKKGDAVFCIELKELGRSYEREKRNDKIKVYKKLVFVVAFAIIGWLVKVIISAILG